MIPTQKRRWHQFNLRGLMMLMTFICVVLARVAYLSECAAFHDQEAAKYAVNQKKIYRSPSTDELVIWVNFQEHRILAERYRYSMYRPWTLVDTTSPYWKPDPLQAKK